MDAFLRRFLPAVWAVLALAAGWLVLTRWAGERREAGEVAPTVIQERWPNGVVVARTLPPVFADPDSSCWIEYTQAVATGTGWRYRESPIGNSPYGRPMLWSHPYLWWSLGVGWATARWEGISWSDGVARGMALTNPLAFVLFLGVWGWLVGRSAGWTAAAGALAMLGASSGVASDFGWWHPDHHGFHLAAMLGSSTALFLGLCPRGAESASPHPPLLFALAGACHGFGLWVGATQQLALTSLSLGCAGLGALLLPAPQLGSWVRAWMAWSAAAVGVVLLGVMVEFAPTFEHCRLEVVHPLHAAFALSAAALARGLVRWRLREKGVLTDLLAALVLAGLYPAAIAAAGPDEYILREPIVWRSTANIAEFQRLDLWASPRGVQLEFGLCLTVLGLLLGRAWQHYRRERVWDLATLWPSLLLAAFVGLWLLQVRWKSWAEAAGTIGLIALLVRRTATVPPTFPSVRGLLQGALALWIGTLIVLEARAAWSRQGISPPLAAALGARDLALELRSSVGPGPIRALGSPNWAPLLYLYGRVQSVDALYWENGPGTIAANLLLAESDPTQAERKVRERGLTHLLVETHPARVAYAGWIGLGTRQPVELQRTLIFSLARSQPQVPSWLEWVGTKTLLGHPAPVRIFRVRPPAPARADAGGAQGSS